MKSNQRSTQNVLFPVPEVPAYIRSRSLGSTSREVNGGETFLHPNEPSKLEIEDFLDRHKDKLHRCAKCRIYFPSREFLQQHLVSHVNDSRITCLHCSEVFDSEATYAVHKVSHVPQSVHVCPNCRGRFVNRLALKKHQLRCTTTPIQASNNWAKVMGGEAVSSSDSDAPGPSVATYAPHTSTSLLSGSNGNSGHGLGNHTSSVSSPSLNDSIGSSNSGYSAGTGSPAVNDGSSNQLSTVSTAPPNSMDSTDVTPGSSTSANLSQTSSPASRKGNAKTSKATTRAGASGADDKGSRVLRVGVNESSMSVPHSMLSPMEASPVLSLPSDPAASLNGPVFKRQGSRQIPSSTRLYAPAVNHFFVPRLPTAPTLQSPSPERTPDVPRWFNGGLAADQLLAQPQLMVAPPPHVNVPLIPGMLKGSGILPLASSPLEGAQANFIFNNGTKVLNSPTLAEAAVREMAGVAVAKRRLSVSPRPRSRPGSATPMYPQPQALFEIIRRPPAYALGETELPTLHGAMGQSLSGGCFKPALKKTTVKRPAESHLPNGPSKDCKVDSFTCHTCGEVLYSPEAFAKHLISHSKNGQVAPVEAVRKKLPVQPNVSETPSNEEFPQNLHLSDVEFDVLTKLEDLDEIFDPECMDVELQKLDESQTSRASLRNGIEDVTSEQVQKAEQNCRGLAERRISTPSAHEDASIYQFRAENSMACPYCPRIFTKERQFNAHLATHKDTVQLL